MRDRKTGERATDEAEAVMYAALSRGLSFKTTMGNILTPHPGPDDHPGGARPGPSTLSTSASPRSSRDSRRPAEPP